MTYKSINQNQTYYKQMLALQKELQKNFTKVLAAAKMIVARIEATQSVTTIGGKKKT